MKDRQTPMRIELPGFRKNRLAVPFSCAILG
jgi:hypothetical protein